MRRRGIAFVLLLLLNMFVFYGCSSNGSESKEEAAPQTMVAENTIYDSYEKTEDVTGIFQGLEGNHTAVFSFDDIETAFHFEEPSVQKIIFEAVAGSTYVLSYYVDPTTGLYTIYEIRES